jgi:hypothetical protein
MFSVPDRAGSHQSRLSAALLEAYSSPSWPWGIQLRLIVVCPVLSCQAKPWLVAEAAVGGGWGLRPDAAVGGGWGLRPGTGGVAQRAPG